MLAIFTSIFIVAASTAGYAQISINGRIAHSDNWEPVLYLSHLKNYTDFFSGYDGLVIDSAQLDHAGNFWFAPAIYQQGWYRLNIQPKGFESRAGMLVGVPQENYVHIYLASGTSEIQLYGSAAQLQQSYQIVGNTECLLAQTIRDIRLPIFIVLEQIMEQFKSLEQLPEAERQQAREQAFAILDPAARNMQARLKVFLDSVQDVNAGLLATKYYYLGDSYSNYAPYFDSLAHKWKSIDSSNHYLTNLLEEVDRFLNSLPVGSKAPNIILNNPEGQPVSLYDLQARLILVDFWASWCGPCRAENKSIVLPLFEKYRKHGFVVFGVSFDTGLERWTNTIEKDGYSWIHVSDLKPVGVSEIAALYRIKSIPTTYLLDVNKQILAKDLRGQQLIDFIQNYIKE